MSDRLISGVYAVDTMKSIQPTIVIALDDQGVVTKDSVLNALSTAFDFPDYFGHNWDAAFDCLCDAIDARDHLDVLFTTSPGATQDKEAIAALVSVLNNVINQQSTEKTVRFFGGGEFL